ncbi:uncharacterized protein LOC119450330 isoform X4 [Dermacentor silvarum]|uniref:uncharacterized protein LOC119450330 isoform X4 n=1 Tax=Dermacentor silvarum TaxID=543639 RepID=UPI0021014E46|nr:uncharacterized protein LOC119450330 isoform X4 [Dermacentor silvarum]
MSFEETVGWCERCRSDGLESPILVYPIGPTDAIKMCSNLECSDMANSIIQVDFVKIEIPKSHKIFTDPSPVEWCDDDGEYHHHCVKVRTSSASSSAGSDPKDQNIRTHHTSASIPGTAKVTTEPLRRHAVDIYDKVPTASNVNPSPDLRPEKCRDRLCQDTTVSASSDTVQGTANPFGEPTVGIGDSAPTALLCVEPPVYVNPVKHVYRTCNTSPSTCVSAGQVSIKPVGEPTINICDSAASESLCADSEVCMDEDEHVYSARDTTASTCGSAGQVFIEPVGEPNINICDNAASESLCAHSEVCMDEDERVYSARDTPASTCGSAGQVFIEPVGEPNINICDNAASESLCAHSKVCMDEDERVYSARDTPASTCGSAGQVSIKPVGEPTINICDSAASESLCTDFKVCMDKDKRVCKAHDTSASTCHEVGQVLALPTCGSAPIQSFGANTSLCIKARDHRYRSHCSIHTPAKAIMPAVGVIASSSGSVFDDSPTISPIADTSLEAKTEKWRDTGGGRVLFKSPISKAVTVKVVASSEHPFCVNRELRSPNPCLETKQENHADEMCDVHQMEKVLKVKIVATSEMEPSCQLSNDVPTLLARGVINSWQEVMTEELEDEVNCAKVKPYHVVEEPAAKNVSVYCPGSTKRSVTPVFSFLLPNTAEGDAVKQKKVMSSPSASHVGFAECHFEHKHWERTKVPLVRESISRNLEKDHALFGAATENADSACATENGSMELINEEDMVVAVPAAIVTNAAFTVCGSIWYNGHREWIFSHKTEFGITL